MCCHHLEGILFSAAILKKNFCCTHSLSKKYIYTYIYIVCIGGELWLVVEEEAMHFTLSPTLRAGFFPFLILFIYLFIAFLNDYYGIGYIFGFTPTWLRVWDNNYKYCSSIFSLFWGECNL